MNKIFKIYIKNNPIFKYVVEDYPFYEGIFFHCQDYFRIYVTSAHYLLRNRINMGNQTLNISQKLKSNLHFKLRISETPIVLGLVIKLKLKSSISLKDDQKSKFKLYSKMRVQMKDKTCFKDNSEAHLIKMTKLKIHDPFILRSRDVMKLSDIDGKIII